jgi:hypothetical protein
MTDNDRWHRPARCGDSACAEWQRHPDGTVSVRSSLRPAETITLTAEEFAAFVVAAKEGQTDV